MITARRRTALALTMLSVAILAGCGDERTAGDQTNGSPSIEVGGEARTYQLYRPDGAEAGPALVVVLHPRDGNALQAERAYGWNDVANAEGFLVAYPDGLDGSWNAGDGCCGAAAEQDVDDVGFLSALIDRLVEEEGIDPTRVYVTGMSNGAMLSYSLACATDTLAAIAPVAGTMLADCTAPAPVSVLHVHGTDDTTVRFDGGIATGNSEVDAPSVPSVIEHWRTVDGCTAPTVTTVGDVQHSITYCAEGREVQLTTVAGAGHEWPGSEDSDSPSSYNTTEAIWRFFEANPRP